MEPWSPPINLTIFTCGKDNLDYFPDWYPRFDCTHLRPPPAEFCDCMDGTSEQFREAFFSDRRARDALVSYEADLRDRLRKVRDKGGEMLKVVVYCQLGVHRSVSMAEMLAKKARKWRPVKVCLEHRDLETGWEEYRKCYGRSLGSRR
ncbi:hypothetical protein MMC17_004226 [Xylographa soralifera]|nr:hypothetical protein [Xylographa soralifera]